MPCCFGGMVSWMVHGLAARSERCTEGRLAAGAPDQPIYPVVITGRCRGAAWPERGDSGKVDFRRGLSGSAWIRHPATPRIRSAGSGETGMA